MERRALDNLTVRLESPRSVAVPLEVLKRHIKARLQGTCDEKTLGACASDLLPLHAQNPVCLAALLSQSSRE